jgi:hypothetical protein
LWLLTCHITNIILIFRAAGRKIWACRLWCWRTSRRWAWLVFRVLRSGIFLIVAVLIHYDFSYLIRRQQRSPRNFTFHWRKLCCDYWVHKKQTLNWHKPQLLQSRFGKCSFPQPNNHYPATRLFVTEIIYFYDPDPSFH